MNIQQRHSDAVQRGVKFLDEFGPEKWWNKIDVMKLDLNMPCRCVLGQLYGSYTKGCQKLDLVDYGGDQARVDYLGFFASFDRGVRDWEALTETWKKAIITRQIQEIQE